VVKTLGRADKQIPLSIVSCPPIDADIVLKTHAFDNVIKQVESYLDTFDYSELSSFLLANIPGTSITAAEQATECGRGIRDSLFSVASISGVINFHDSEGQELATDKVIKPVPERPKDISSVSLAVKVDAKAFLPAEVSDDPNPEPFFGVFLLNLPQTLINTDGSPARRLFGEENLNSPPKKKIDVGDLPLLTTDGTVDVSKLGDKDGTDTLEDYSTAVINLLSDAQAFTYGNAPRLRVRAD
jgi:hypothetical protein